MPGLARFVLTSLVLFTVAGCPDPTAGKGAKGGGSPGGAPGGGGSSGPVHPGQMAFKLAPGEGVKVAGTILYAGTKTGTLRLDILRTPSSEGSFPELLHSSTLDAPGPWEVEAPKGTGSVGVVVFMDADGNGPSAGEPAAHVIVDVQQAPVAGVDLTLVDDGDLGPFRPPGGSQAPPPGAGGAPPGDAGAPGAPPGGPPPGGEGGSSPPAGQGSPFGGPLREGGAPPAGSPPPGSPPPGSPPAGAPPGAPPGGPPPAAGS